LILSPVSFLAAKEVSQPEEESDEEETNNSVVHSENTPP